MLENDFLGREQIPVFSYLEFWEIFSPWRYFPAKGENELHQLWAENILFWKYLNITWLSMEEKCFSREVAENIVSSFCVESDITHCSVFGWVFK